MALWRGATRLGLSLAPRSIHTMRPVTLKALTWATVAAAVASALWLAVFDGDATAMLRWTAALLPPASGA